MRYIGGLARYAVGGAKRYTPEELENLTHAELYSLRNKLGVDQELLAPLEHRAFAREWTREMPWLAIPSLVGAIPGYTAGKALGLIKARSPASLEEILQGYRGLGEGVMSLFRE